MDGTLRWIHSLLFLPWNTNELTCWRNEVVDHFYAIKVNHHSSAERKKRVPHSLFEENLYQKHYCEIKYIVFSVWMKLGCFRHALTNLEFLYVDVILYAVRCLIQALCGSVWDTRWMLSVIGLESTCDTNKTGKPTLCHTVHSLLHLSAASSTSEKQQIH